MLHSNSHNFLWEFFYIIVLINNPPIIMMKIKQAVAKIVLQDKSHYWLRISRQKIESIIYNFRSIYNFYYAKIFEIIDYKKGTQHLIGGQIGYITLNGYNF